MRTLLLAALTAALAAPVSAQDGLTLFQPQQGTTAYLIDGANNIVNSWSGSDRPGLAVYLLPDGDLLRTQKVVPGLGAGYGGAIQRVSYTGQLEWEYAFFDATHTPHHDIEALPNGNVLAIVYEQVGAAGAIALGRDPTTVGTSFMVEEIRELQPVGHDGAVVVWEWHVADHLVQDFDPAKPGFGVISDHPELVDVNYGPDADWLHCNTVSYNPALDQIALSIPRFGEIWIIDHSTTTAEAAGHTGGNSGKGGDLLYRYGNPVVYGRGTAADKKFFFQHDVQWIPPGYPGAGNLILFNNGQGRPGGDYTSIDEWTPPVDANGAYTLAPGQAFGPATFAWTYSDPGAFYSAFEGGVQRLENGNTVICEALSGTLFEVDPSGATTWMFVNPFETPNTVFKARRYADCDDDGLFDGMEIARGVETDANGNGVPDACEPIGTPECFGDGSGAACPCGNTGAAGEGCANATGAGALLAAGGSASVARDDLVLLVSQAPPNKNGVFLQGASAIAAPFQDGILCVGDPTERLEVVRTDAFGAAASGVSIVSAGAVLAGDTRWYQFWYRDGFGPCGGSNLSGALRVLWQ